MLILGDSERRIIGLQNGVSFSAQKIKVELVFTILRLRT
jgi:hypothetical protein